MYICRYALKTYGYGKLFNQFNKKFFCQFYISKFWQFMRLDSKSDLGTKHLRAKVLIGFRIIYSLGQDTFIMKHYHAITLSVLLLLSPVQIIAIPIPTDPDPAYTQVINQRSQKIVDTLGISDAEKALAVRNAIVDQYRSLSMLHDTLDVQINDVTTQCDEKKELADQMIQQLRNMTQNLLDKLHTQYLVKLSSTLTPDQIDKVKDGMTYGIVHVTYNSYLDMLPDLTDEQKAQIHEYLIQAREIAMDAGSSKAKHGCFGKYKGKINNYLSAQGYDLNKASKERNQKTQSSPDKPNE